MQVQGIDVPQASTMAMRVAEAKDLLAWFEEVSIIGQEGLDANVAQDLRVAALRAARVCSLGTQVNECQDSAGSVLPMACICRRQDSGWMVARGPSPARLVARARSPWAAAPM